MSFDEVGFGYSAEMALAEAQRCLQCKNPTCQDGCPVNIDISGFIGAIIDGDYAGGVAVLKERNALPAVCGRVCPQEEQCEASCVLAKKGEPVAIGRLERFLGDTDLACEIEHRCVPEVAPPSGYRCAIVGSGPSGLACAGELAQLGHDGHRLRVAARARRRARPTASPSSACPRRSSPPRSRCCQPWG